MNIATLLSGGDFVGVGARAAGLTHTWGIEWDGAIAGVAHANGFDGVIVADVLGIDPHTLAVPDVLHASPVCTNASQANSSAELNEDGTKESNLDIAVGEKVAQFIDALKPRVVTIENVYAYRNFKAFGKITAALTRNGYFWDYDNLNAADFGVPQTRRRLILRSVRGALLPNLPPPEPWIGWYAAIEDLIPTLPASQFAPWQLARLPELLQTTLVERHGAMNLQDRAPQMIGAHCPDWTVRASERQLEMATAFIMAGSGNTNFDDAEPGAGVLYAGAPAHVVSSDGGGRTPRAFLMSNDNTQQEWGEPIVPAESPARTVRARGGTKAFIVDGQGASPLTGEPTCRTSAHPMFTVTKSAAKGMARAWLSQGRVVSMTPRALARFQSAPDDYVLPNKASLACKVIGNGVPPLLYQKIIGPLCVAAGLAA